MSGLDKDRKRNQTVCFRMTPEERRELEARIKVSGLPKALLFHMKPSRISCWKSCHKCEQKQRRKRY